MVFKDWWSLFADIFISNRGNNTTDAHIISFPKCGRTWLRLLIGKYLCDKFHLTDEDLLNTYKLTSVAGLLRTKVTHDYSSIRERYKYYQLPTDKRQYAGKKVVFLVRNIKDVLVSCYFQATKRINRYSGSISDFIRSDRYGVRKVITFYTIWYNKKDVPREFLLLRYEAMYDNPGKVLVQTLNFLGLEDVENLIVDKAINFASFTNMKKLEKENFFKKSIMTPGNIRDEESYKIRRGIVGGYSSYLSDEDVQYIDRIIGEMGCPLNFGNEPVQQFK